MTAFRLVSNILSRLNSYFFHFKTSICLFQEFSERTTGLLGSVHKFKAGEKMEIVGFWLPFCVREAKELIKVHSVLGFILILHSCFGVSFFLSTFWFLSLSLLPCLRKATALHMKESCICWLESYSISGIHTWICRWTDAPDRVPPSPCLQIREEAYSGASPLKLQQ